MPNWKDARSCELISCQIAEKGHGKHCEIQPPLSASEDASAVQIRAWILGFGVVIPILAAKRFSQALFDQRGMGRAQSSVARRHRIQGSSSCCNTGRRQLSHVPHAILRLRCIGIAPLAVDSEPEHPRLGWNASIKGTGAIIELFCPRWRNCPCS